MQFPKRLSSFQDVVQGRRTNADCCHCPPSFRFDISELNSLEIVSSVSSLVHRFPMITRDVRVAATSAPRSDGRRSKVIDHQTVASV